MRSYILTGILCAVAVATGFIHVFLPVVAIPMAFLISYLVRTRERIHLSDIAELKAAPGEPPAPGRLWLTGSWLLSCPGCASAEVKLPADLATIRKLSRVRGPFRFRKTVSAEDLPTNAQKYLFRGNGLAGTGKLFVNGKKIGENIPGYIPFEVDITPYVVPGAQLEIVLETMLDSVAKGPGRELGLAPAFCSGVFRELWIDGQGSVEIIKVRLKRDDDGTGDVLFLDMLGNTEFPVAVAIDVSSVKTGGTVAKFEKILHPFSGSNTVAFILPSNCIKLWRPSDPELYEIKTKMIVENSVREKKVVTGLCDMDNRGGVLRVNGRDIRLRGVIRSEHYPPYGAAVPAWAAKKDVSAIKEIHMNFVYSQDYPPHPKFLEECDRQGLFVAAEFPYKQVRAAVGAEAAKGLLTDFLENVSVHPSFLWLTIDGNVSAGDLPGGNLRGKILLDNSSNQEMVPDTFGFSKKFVDLYTAGHHERTVIRAGGTGLLVLDFIDTEAGREPRTKREMRKAAQDLETLKAADKKNVRALVLGRFFTWGLASGIFSINRTKKASAITIASHIQTGGEGEINWSHLPLQMSSRIVILISAIALMLTALMPQWRNVYMTAPGGLPYIQPMWHSALLFVFAQVCGCFGISIYFNMQRRALTGAASMMGYSSFMNVFTSDSLRAVIYAVVNIWLVYTGTAAVYAVTGIELSMLFSLIMTASMFDVMLVFSMAGPVRPVVSIAASSIMQAAVLSYSLGPAGAVIFALIRLIPWTIIFISIERKNIFKM